MTMVCITSFRIEYCAPQLAMLASEGSQHGTRSGWCLRNGTYWLVLNAVSTCSGNRSLVTEFVPNRAALVI